MRGGRGIEVALNGVIAADRFPGVVDRRAPIDADHVAARLAELPENRARADAEVNRGHSERRDAVEDALGVRQDELAVVARVELSYPGVEHLHRVDAGFDLRRR